MGLGLQGSGIAAAKFFARLGARVTVTDIKTREKLSSSIERLKEYKNITFVLGQHRSEDFKNTDLVIKGPGVPNDSKYLEIARKNKVAIDTEGGVFFSAVKNPVIGVTGTRGKSTTTQIIYELLRAAGRKVVIGGNISGKPLLGLLELVKKESFLVLELSSFQLEGIRPRKKSPHIAVVTNFMADHLNRYKNLESYHEAKEAIVRYQTNDDFAVLNYDDAKVRLLAPGLKSRVWFFSLEKLGGENVAFIFDGKVILRRGKEEEVITEIKKLKLIGEHRIPNLLAAACVAGILKIPTAVIRQVFESFAGIEHRLEVVRSVNGVLYVNDTAATVPEAAKHALRTFKDPVILISGGSDKGLDFKDLASEIISRAKGLILLKGGGTDRLVARINQQLPEGLRGSLKIVETMEKAVEIASAEADPGDVVLLSPGCTSFEMFDNEFDRGDRFKEAVMKLEENI